MPNTVKLILATILVVAAFFGEQIIEIVKNNVEIVNTPSVNVDEPTLEYKTLVQKVVDMDIDKKDATQISDFFLEVADVVKSDPGFLDSTGKFREFNIKSGGLNFAGLDLKDKYPNLGEEIDSIIVNTIGLEDSQLTAKKRKSLHDSLSAIAWGVHQ
ncbi:MAG: hypothetical protein FI729_00970 [SAR202 cluster bacterium]|nr:hypothetical protein [SAR202 cluster bacterium]|tara:strand:- start:1000 stop:1470 length:471 start_codon:yes stop_codon:yes gene_type:complete